MTQQMERYSRRLAACLAILTVLVIWGVSVTRASGDKDSGKSNGAPAAPIRTSAAKQGKRRLAEERAMLNALVGRRDPFKLPPPPQAGGGRDEIEGPLPPGSRGLVIGRITLKGIVREDASDAMIAVVTNRSNLAYFLRVHDQVYNGVVTKITADSIYFSADRLDPAGGAKTRVVILKLSSGQQEAR